MAQSYNPTTTEIIVGLSYMLPGHIGYVDGQYVLLNDHNDGNITATIIFEDDNRAYKDPTCQVQFTLEELFDAFVKGAIVSHNSSGWVSKPYAITSAGGYIKTEIDDVYAAGFEPGGGPV